MRRGWLNKRGLWWTACVEEAFRARDKSGENWGRGEVTEKTSPYAGLICFSARIEYHKAESKRQTNRQGNDSNKWLYSHDLYIIQSEMQISKIPHAGDDLCSEYH